MPVELAWAQPHLHPGGIYAQLQDAVTNRTLCEASTENGGVVYGTGLEAGNERGYLVGIRGCRWNRTSAPTFERGHPMRVTAAYDASEYITGAMAKINLMGHFPIPDGGRRLLDKMHERRTSTVDAAWVRAEDVHVGRGRRA